MRKITGGCQCGAVRYEIDAEPMVALHCECLDCKKSQARPYHSWRLPKGVHITGTKGYSSPTDWRNSDARVLPGMRRKDELQVKRDTRNAGHHSWIDGRSQRDFAVDCRVSQAACELGLSRSSPAGRRGCATEPVNSN